MGQGIDRRGIKSVLDGYEQFHNQSEKAQFSVWQGKLLKFVYPGNNYDEGRELLEENLECINISRSESIYTIRVHKTTDKDNMISDNTPYYGSFNFKVFDEYGASQNGARPTMDDYFKKRVEELEKKIEGMSGMGDADNTPLNKEEFVLQLMENPFVQQIGQAIISGVFGRNNNTGNNYNRSGGMAGTDTPTKKRTRKPVTGITVVGEENRAAQEAKCIKALEILYPIDTTIGDNLMKLATLAQTDPNKYWIAVSFL